MMGDLVFRKAEWADVISVIDLVWADALRKADRDTPSFDLKAYAAQFEKISNDGNQYLLVVENEQKEIVATCHITSLHYLPFFDRRVLVEYVRVKAEMKGQGIGRKMFEWIENKSIEWQANTIQLTTDARREDAQAFYKSLGYLPSHIGMKRILKSK